MNSLILGLLLALCAPLFLIPIETLLPYPSLIEEAVKLLIVFMIYDSPLRLKSYEGQVRFRNYDSKIGWIVLAGVLFTLSESMFYLINIFMVGDLSLFGTRLILTGVLHIGTMVILSLCSRRGFVGMMVGYGIAAGIHYWYNANIVRFMI